MENLMESNERTLVIFDSVCLGLAECLALVHNDIKHMSEHRQRLVAQQRKEAQQGETMTEILMVDNKFNTPANESLEHSGDKSRSVERNGHSHSARPKRSTTTKVDQDDDPHHLARLKLLDKRLADTFSQALSMCDQQNSCLIAKRGQQQSVGARASILRLLLGRSSHAASEANDKQQEPSLSEDEQRRAMIKDINRQTRLAIQYSKQLEMNLLKIEDLRAQFEMHLRMGLVVKGVGRTYLSNSSSSSSPSSSPALASTLSHNSLGRHSRPAHHTSSLLVNDSSSSLGTHSSVSSLNLLSTWSFSRRNKHKQRQLQQQQQLDQHQQLANQRFVSTISLDSQSRRAKHRSLSGLASKLISPTSADLQHDASYYDYEQQYDEYLPLPTSNQQLPISGQRPGETLLHGDRAPLESRARPLSQYGYADYGLGAVPTTTGTLAGLKPAPIAAHHHHQQQPTVPRAMPHVLFNGGGGGALHKSASHSSLKRAHKNQQVVANSKTTTRDIIENINRLESEFESYMGSFMLNIEDIQGFARVCQGDVFEVSIRYGDSQKFKTKISVLKDSKQKCDNRHTVFKAKIADVIAIKAYECKGLGKRVLLGNKLCETRDLFTARSQLMTISLNHTGSIKLNLIITWNPLHMVPNSTLAQVSPDHDIGHFGASCSIDRG